MKLQGLGFYFLKTLAGSVAVKKSDYEPIGCEQALPQTAWAFAMSRV